MIRHLRPWLATLGARRPAAAPLLAGLTCLLVLLGLRDSRLLPVPSVPEPPPAPVAADDRIGQLAVTVVERCATPGCPEEPVAGASVRVLWEQDRVFFLGGSGTTDDRGQLALDALPAGPSWVLVEAEGRARRSTPLLVGPGARVRLALPPAQALSVTVTDEQGAPLPRATVLVRDSDPLPFGALTAGDGKARVGRLDGPPWSVKASAPGYESATADGVRGDVTLALRRLSALSVRVEQPDGAPAAGATVLIAGAGLWPARKAETDRDGLARITGLVAGSYDLKASRGSLVSDTVYGARVQRGSEPTVTLRLAAGRMVTARVSAGDADDAEPIAGADVVLAESGLSPFPLHGRTDREGLVTLGPIAAGPATLAAQAPGFVPRAAIPVPEPLEGPVRIGLLRGGTLRGEVVDAQGFPVDGASIEIVGSDLYGLPIAETPLLVSFRRAHFDWSLAGPPSLIPMGELGVTMGPVPPIPAAGSAPPVTTWAASDSSPAFSEIRGQLEYEAWVTRSDGTFVARPVTPGRVHALVRHPAYVEGISEAVTLAPGGEASVRIVLRGGGRLEGRILDDRGFPLAGARVEVRAARGSLQRSVLSESDGAYAFAALPEDVVLCVFRPGEHQRCALRRPVSVADGRRNELDIELPAARQPVRVLVATRDGDPVESAQVTVLSVDPAAPLRQTQFTGGDGAVTVDDARGLALRVTVEASGFAPLARNVGSAGETLTLHLERAVTIAGRVTAVRGRQPVGGATISVSAGGYRRSVISAEDGSFRLRDVPAGRVRLVVAHPDFATAEATARVERPERADREFSLPDIDLTEAGAIAGQVVDARGQPVAGARVAVGIVPAYLPAGALPAGLAIADSSGRFRLSGVAPGMVTVSAYASGAGRGSTGSVEVVAGRTTSDVAIVLADTSEEQGDTIALGSVAVTLGEQVIADVLEIVIVHVADQSEAERAGLQSGDIVVAIDGVTPQSLGEARNRLNGAPATDVVIEIERRGRSSRLRVAREQVRR